MSKVVPEVPFHRRARARNEAAYVTEALNSDKLCAGSTFSQRCESWLQAHLPVTRALLTHSCTNALEITAILAGLQPGDEVIMPTFTFTSTANAFALRGAVPVFVDVQPDTFNLCPDAAARAITAKTRAIVPVHYAGIACDMDAIMALAKAHDLIVIEDAAQGFGASWRGRPLGSIGHLGAYSFHHSKTISCGEGGALLLNSPEHVARAEVLLDKGTDRKLHQAGMVSQYSWVDLGLSAPPSAMQAACLLAQLEESDALLQRYRAVWSSWHAALADAEQAGLLRRPSPPADTQHNGHIYAVLLPDANRRDALAKALQETGIQTARHYYPLHLSDAGRRYGRHNGSLIHAEAINARLLRLPVYPELPSGIPDQVAEMVARLFSIPPCGDSSSLNTQ